MLTGMLAGTSASSLRVQITRLAWLLQEQAAGQEVAGGEPPPAADVKATPPPPAPRGGEKSQRKSRAPWGQDILPGSGGGHGEPWAHAILNVHAPRGRRGAVGRETGRGSMRDRDPVWPICSPADQAALGPVLRHHAHFMELTAEAGGTGEEVYPGLPGQHQRRSIDSKLSSLHAFQKVDK